MTCTPSQLLYRARSAGGDIRLGPKGELIINDVTPVLRAQVLRESYCITALLREARAARAAEAAGHDPRRWWRPTSRMSRSRFLVANLTTGRVPVTTFGTRSRNWRA
jgi:hypothetical protein